MQSRQNCTAKLSGDGSFTTLSRRTPIVSFERAGTRKKIILSKKTDALANKSPLFLNHFKFENQKKTSHCKAAARSFVGTTNDNTTRKRQDLSSLETSATSEQSIFPALFTVKTGRIIHSTLFSQPPPTVFHCLIFIDYCKNICKS